MPEKQITVEIEQLNRSGNFSSLRTLLANRDARTKVNSFRICILKVRAQIGPVNFWTNRASDPTARPANHGTTSSPQYSSAILRPARYPFRRQASQTGNLPVVLGV
jgi:hypothetical protein